jgi:two-component system chemotaxis response regulator CheB
VGASPPRRFVILDDDAAQRRLVSRAIETAGGVVVAAVDKVAAAGRAVSISSPDAMVCRLRSCGTPCSLQRGPPRFAHEEARATTLCPAIGTVRVVENLVPPQSEQDAAAAKAIAGIRWPEPQTPPPSNKWPIPTFSTPPPARMRSLFQPPPPPTPPPSSPTPSPPLAARQRELLAIGSSTGGPRAVQQLLCGLPPTFQLPIVMVQHMPKNHLVFFADSLARQCARPVELVSARHRLQPGNIYLASGDGHIGIERFGGDLYVDVIGGPAEHNCVPAVDPLLRTVAAVVGAAAIVVVLTGMGIDGAAGALAVHDAGGTVLVQDQASSVVWGMPGATVAIGAADQVLPLNDLAPQVARLATAE